MALPGINFTFNDGALGLQAASIDGTAGFITTGAAVTGGIQLNQPYLITDMNSLAALGVNEQYDFDNSTMLYYHCEEFFRVKASKNQTAELYIMILPATTPLGELADVENVEGATKLLQYAQGRINLLAIGSLPVQASAEVKASITFQVSDAGLESDVVQVKVGTEIIATYVIPPTPDVESVAEGIIASLPSPYTGSTGGGGEFTINAPSGTGASANGVSVSIASNGNFATTGISEIFSGGTDAVFVTPTLTNGIDQEVITAIAKAQELAEYALAEKQPLFIVIEGRNLASAGTLGALKNAKELNAPNVAVIIAQDKALANESYLFAKHAAVGTALGALSAAQVNHSIAWVGQFNIESLAQLAFLAPALSNGDLIINLSSGLLTTIADKGYIFIRTFPNVQGCYFSDSPTATAATSDYSTIENVRVVNKVVRRVYQALIPRLNSPVLLEPGTGKIAPDVAASFESNCSFAVADMLTNQEASRITFSVDPNQNILATQKLNVQARILPTGKAREIVVNIGFTNPLANN